MIGILGMIGIPGRSGFPRMIRIPCMSGNPDMFRIPGMIGDAFFLLHPKNYYNLSQW